MAGVVAWLDIGVDIIESSGIVGWFALFALALPLGNWMERYWGQTQNGERTFRIGNALILLVLALLALTYADGRPDFNFLVMFGFLWLVVKFWRVLFGWITRIGRGPSPMGRRY